MTTKQSQPLSTRILLLGVWSHLSLRRRIQLGCLLLVMLASGGAELVSLGAVLPFLAVLSDPEILWKQSLVQDLSVRLGFTEASELILPATFGFAAAAVFAALIRLINLWLNSRLAAAVGSDLSCEAYKRILYQPYDFHVKRNSANVINVITTQISQTIGALKALLQLLTSVVVAAGLLTGLVLIDAPVAVSAAVLFGGLYWVLAIISRRELRLNGLKISETSVLQLKALQEGLGAIRDVLLDGSQPTYLKIYRQADRPQRQLEAKNFFIGAFPRFSIEALAMVSLALLGGILAVQRNSGASIIPLLGAVALGAQRLLPALQQIYAGWATLKGYDAAIQGVLGILKQPLPPSIDFTEPWQLCTGIRMECVYFRYGLEQPDVLKGLDLEISCGERIGIVGSTGNGKSTTLDILMGLLVPSAGKILVDGLDLHDPDHPERLVAWRAAIAHVPQTIYLADISIAENIAFGVPKDAIDMSLVRRAAQQAQIAEFIESTSQSYASHVGERGISLSGGQRQRIGIARALYKKANMLILDEATSALDTATETLVVESLEGLSRNLTIVMIAHRLSSLEHCDRIIKLEHGVVVADGPPCQIITREH